MRIIFPLFFIVLLSACGGGGSSGGVSFDPQTPSDTPKVPPTEVVPETEPVPDVEEQKVVVLEWEKPDERENGDYLEESEIGGYEIRYRQPGQEDYKTVIIEDGLVEKYEFTEPVGTNEFEIASYDTDGLYSVFIPLTGREEVL